MPCRCFALQGTFKLRCAGRNTHKMVGSPKEPEVHRSFVPFMSPFIVEKEVLPSELMGAGKRKRMPQALAQLLHFSLSFFRNLLFSLA